MTVSKPKILILTHCYPSDPSDIPGNFLTDLCGDLVFRGAELTVITQKMNRIYDSEFLKNSGADIIYFLWRGGNERFSGLKLSSFKDILNACSLLYNGRKAYRKISKTKKFDLVLSCWLIPAGFWSLSCSKKNNHAVWALGSDVSVYAKKILHRQLLKFIVSKNKLIFTNSINHQKIIKAVLKSESELLYTGRQLPVSEKIYQKSETLRLIFIGRLEKIKGPDILISALIMSGIKSFELKIIGDGSLKDDLQNTVKINGLENKIIFLGEKNGNDIADELTVSDYLVISSRSESMPVVFWEAMQTSTPVLSTDVGDIGYYCEKFNAGRVCQAEVKPLSELFLFADNFRPLRDSLSKNTVKVKDLSSIKHSAEKLFEKASEFYEPEGK